MGIGKKLTVAGCVALAALAAVELGLRKYRPVTYMQPARAPSADREAWHGTIHQPSTTPGLAYELAPNVDQEVTTNSLGMHVTTNSLGMRDREPLAAETPGLVRVLALGDSVTFAYLVEEADGFPRVLEESLAKSPLAKGRVFDVLNVGVSGYSTRDELAAFEGKWLALAPRVVFLGYCINDPEIEPQQPLQRTFVEPAWWQHLHLTRFVAQKLHGWKVRDLGGGDYMRYLHAPGEPPWQSVVDAFARFGELARERHIAFVVVIFPMFSMKPWKDYAFRDVHAQVAAEATKDGLQVLDLLPRFEREDPTTLPLAPDESHPNAFGHRIAAEELLRFLEARPELVDAH